MTRYGRVVAVALAVILAGPFLFGCAQNTEAPVKAGAEQATKTPAVTTQEQGTQGSNVHINVYNCPPPNTFSLGSVVLPGEEKLPWNTQAAPAGTNGTGHETNSGYAIVGNTYTFTITTGGTAPNMTGTATASASPVQRQTANPTASPVQRIEPVVDVPVALGFGGSAPSAQGNAAGRGATTSGQSQAPTNDIRWASVLQKLGQCGADA